MIADVDEFIIYDDMQFTKNDWRNRNLIKSPNGLLWLSIPVGIDINRRIRDVSIIEKKWQVKHWKTLHSNYAKAPFFMEIAEWLEPLFLNESFDNLHVLNKTLIESICKYLNIKTIIKNSWDYKLVDGKTERLISLCKQSGATKYLSGPAAKSYLDESLFQEAGIELLWQDYSNYPQYPQLWGDYVHGVSILDLLFNCGKDSLTYMKTNHKTTT
jgi:hypothetical protein